jgi:hypothetical protein
VPVERCEETDEERRFASHPTSYTSTMARKRPRERDIVQELQEDAKWSMWTNTFVRKRGLGRPRSIPHGPGVGTFMLAAILIVGSVVGVIAVIAVLLTLG